LQNIEGFDSVLAIMLWTFCMRRRAYVNKHKLGLM